MSSLEKTDRIAHIVLIVAVVGACAAPFALGVLKDADTHPADQSTAVLAQAVSQEVTRAARPAAPQATRVKLRGAMSEAQFMPALDLRASPL